nr:hypothetical protein [Tanacetum cinerariifolium]
MADVEEVLHDREKFIQDTQTFLEKFNRFSFGFTPRVLTIAWERIDKIKYVLTKPEEIPELMYKDEEYTIQYREYLEKSPDAVTTILPTEEPEHSLSMGYEHLSTTPETELDEVTESSVKNLVPIPSECEVTSEDEIECDKPAKDESSSIFMTFSNLLFDYNDDFTSSDDESLPDEDVSAGEFKIYSNPIFDEDEISSDKLESHCFNVESNFVESLLNRNTLIDSFPKFDFLLKEFSEIPKSDFDFEEEIRLIENLLYDNSSPRPTEAFNAEIAETIIEPISSSLIPIQDNESQQEEIDIATNMDVLPPGFDDYDPGEIDVDNPIPRSENELSDFYQDDPSFPRPPPKPPDDELDLEPDSGKDISAVVNKDVSDDENDDYYSFMFVIQFFLPYLIFPEISLLFLSAESEDIIFDPGISI